MRTIGKTTVCILLLVGPLTAQERPKKADLVRTAEHHLSTDSFLYARQAADQCLQHYPRERRCRTVRDRAMRELRAGWERQLSKAHINDLPARERALEQLALYHAPSEQSVRALADVRETRRRLVEESRLYAARVRDGSSEAPPAVVTPYLPYVPELATVLEEAETHRALNDADRAAAAGDVHRAVATLKPREKNSEVRARLLSLERRLEELLAAQVDAAIASGSLVSLNEAYVAVAGATLLSDERRTDAARRLGTEAGRVVKEAVGIQGLDPQVIAASEGGLVRALDDRLPAGMGAWLPWDEVLGVDAAGPSSITIGVPGATCVDLTIHALARQVEGAVPSELKRLTRGGLAIELTDITCALETEVTGQEPVNSTYVGSYQQVANEDYVRLQQELANAQQELRALQLEDQLQPAQNGWIAAARGLQLGRARNRVRAVSDRLAQTPPFLSRSVHLQYTPYRFSTAKVARLSATLTVSDSATGFANGFGVNGKSVHVGDGVRDVLPGDSSGLMNKMPDLPTDRVALDAAAADLAEGLAGRLRAFGSQAAFQRAAWAQTSGLAVPAVGYLLLAEELGAPAEWLAASREDVAAFRASALDALPGFRLSNRAIRRPMERGNTEAKPAPAASTGTNRAAMLSDALSAVVSITAGASSGSGFFVGSGGSIVTNAHVVNGASRIVVRTRSQDTYLAQIVKVSPSDDLALLKVVGASVAGLRLTRDAVPVGVDVVAVGSPLGLEGTVTRGIVSAVRTVAGVQYVQTDAAISPGSSGGPLLDDAGTVVGVSTWKLADVGVEALGFAVSATHLRRVFGTLLD